MAGKRPSPRGRGEESGRKIVSRKMNGTFVSFVCFVVSSLPGEADSDRRMADKNMRNRNTGYKNGSKLAVRLPAGA
jgi:hypothetical protein